MTSTHTQPTFAGNPEYLAARRAFEDTFVALAGAEAAPTVAPREHKKLAKALNGAEAEFFKVCERLEAQPQYHPPLLATAGLGL